MKRADRSYYIKSEPEWLEILYWHRPSLRDTVIKRVDGKYVSEKMHWLGGSSSWKQK